MTSAPWHRHYDAGVPTSLAPYPEKTLLDYVADGVRRAPEAPALLFQGTRVSRAELDRLSDRFAAALAGLGIERGDRVGLLLPNCPQFLIAELGAWKAGATVVPLNPIYTEPELERALVRTGCVVVVVLTMFHARLKAVQPRTPVRTVISTSIAEFLPPLMRLAFRLFLEKKGGHRARLEKGDLRFVSLLRTDGPRPLSPARPDDIALILMSGGTTGTPKGVACAHRGLVTTGLQATAWIRPTLGERQASMALPLPLFHAAGGILGQATCLVGGHTLVLIPNPRDLKDLLRTIRRTRPTFLAGVPTLYNAILNRPEVASGKIDLRSIELCVSGAAPLAAETKRRFEAVTGGRLVQAYSLTEALIAPIMQPVRGPTKEGAVGVPGPDVELCVRDAENGETPLPAGAVGEITLRAPQIMTAYWEDPAETAIALRPHGPGAPWLHTGDLGYVDEDGFLFLVDRLKDLIKSGGYQVWPWEIEEVLASHPAVAEVGVAGIPDAARGEIPKAWVVLRPGVCCTAEEIRAFCRERLAPYKIPGEVAFREELPKSVIGKVLRRLLRQEHAVTS
jgi:long-chain acyl-CoA synthetase